MRDFNSGIRSFDVWLVAGLFLAFAFTAGAASGADNAAWVSYSGVPSAMHPGDTATVTVTMRNTGTTTWETTVDRETVGSTLTTTRTFFSLVAVGHGWDVGSVRLTGSVAPNATRSFQFTITAPATTTKRNYVFQWQMARNTVVNERPTRPRSPGTFGAATTSLTIQVGPDMAPSFGGAEVPAQEWLTARAISPLTLPVATGGNGTLSYTLTCYLPGGVTFNPTTRQISGTPRTVWGPTDCTWKVTDSDDNTAASDSDTETFTIRARRPALVLSTASLTVEEGEDETFTVKLAAPPTGNVTVVVTSGDADAAGASPASLTFTAANYGTAQTVTVSGVDEQRLDFDDESTSIGLRAGGGGYNGVSASVAVTVDDDEIDTEPTFGNQTIPDQRWERGSTISVHLPAATGGNAPLTYTLSPEEPDGVTFSASTRTLSGTPTATQDARDYTYTVTDADGDTDTLEFTITVVEPDTAPAFRPGARISDIFVTQDLTFGPFALPAASGGNGALIYTLSPEEPDGVTLDPSTRMLSGTPTATQSATRYTYTVADSDSNTSASDTDTLTFRITIVEPDTEPSFGGQEIRNQRWVRGTAIAGGTLPAASRGNAPLSYTLSPSLPDGVTFYPSSQQVWGTPTVTQGVTPYTYRVTDADGDTDTLTFTIEVVPPDTAPSFGGETIPAQMWMSGTAIEPVDLPAATGGNGNLTYRLSPAPPAGVAFNATTRILSGTPTATQGATTYTYTVTDADANTAASDTDTLTFTIAVEVEDTPPSFGAETADDLEWVEDMAIASVELPAATGGNGDLTYSLSPSPPAGVTFNATARTLSGTPTAAQGATTYTYTAADSDGNTAASDTATLTFTIAVEEEDTPPVFSRPAGNLEWVQGTAISPVTLPGATEGNGDLTYSLSPSPPAGVTFNATARTLSGTPTTTQDATEYTYTVTDADGNTAASDADAQQFTITIVEEDTAPAFSETAGDLEWVSGTAIGPVELPVATGGNGDLTYALSPSPPAGVTFSPSTRMLSGMPTTTQTVTEYTYTVTDSDGNTTASDADTQRFTITIAEEVVDTAPSFGGETAEDLILTRNEAMTAATLPEATGGNGDLTYALAGELPAGVTFNATTRTLSGTPTERPPAVQYTYTVTDADGNTASSDTDSLTFTIEVAGMGTDDASFVSYTNVPSTMTAGSMATVTVRMQNTGTTTWTSADGYELGSRRPLDNVTWGLNRVSLPADVAPNATVDFTFAITAPATVQGHKFSWRMVRGASGWFGRKTDLLEIAVETAASPSFGASTILGQTWVKDAAIDALTLPAATGGTGELTYALTGTLPAGVSFDASIRTLSGTPTRRQDATAYTYTATDTDGDAASLTFTIQVAGRASDDASFVSYIDVPSTMAASSSATVTVRMQNTGTTTWTSADGYQLGSQRPQDNVTWGSSRVALPSDVAPNAMVDFTFAITAPATLQGHNFRWRMLRGTSGWFGDKTELREITVGANEAPSFGAETIPAQTWVKNTAIAALTLPEATGGNGDLTYAVAGDLPAGVTFDASTRTLSGTPAKKLAATEYTYTATDTDGDAASLTFTIQVAGRASDDASFVSYIDVPSTMAAGSSATVTVRMQNTGTTTWTSASGYQLGSQRPQDNVTWGLSRVALASDVAPNGTVDFTFAITAPATVKAHNFRWRMLRGTDGWFGDKTEIVPIEVEDPSFGDAAILDQTWARGVPIDALTLPAASGSGGVLTYALTPSLPNGLAFTASTRTVSGTPTTVQAATQYTYTATDVDGDAATLVFTIAIEASEIDDASFVSVSGVPSKIAAGGTATVTVTMTNTGTTTWTSSAGYGLGSQSPQDNATWGLSRVSVPSDVAPNASAAFTFTITAPATTGDQTFAWQMVRDPGSWFGSGTGGVTITVEDPSFGDVTIADQTWVQNEAINTLTLPEAGGVGGGLTYALTPSPPAGVTFDASTRALSGTPTAAQGATEYTYTATDAQGSAATLSFTIEIEAAETDDASFVSVSGVPSRMAAGGTAAVTVTMTNTGTTTWTSSAGYGLGSDSAQNDTWGLSRVSVSGSVAPNETASFTFTITAPATSGSYTFAWSMVRDPGTRFGSGTGTVMITVEDPSFGDATIADLRWVQNTAIVALTLPAASGSGGGLTYALTPSLPDGVGFDPTTRVLSGTPTAAQAATAYAYTATDANGDAATLAFTITVNQASASSSSSSSSTALPPSEPTEPTGVFDMFEYWLLPHGSALTVQARLRDGRIAPAEGSSYVRSFWRGDLWGRNVALLGDPRGERYDLFEEVADGLDYWGTFEGAAGGGEARPSASLDRPFRWMNRFMAVGDALESPVTGRLLSSRRRNQESVVEATMRLEIVSHRASFTVPGIDGLTFEDVLEVRFWPDVERVEAHDTFYVARGFGAVYMVRSAVAAPGGVVEWWAVEQALTQVAASAPSVPWFDPFSPGWPKTAVLNGNLDDSADGVEGAQVTSPEVPGWTAASGDALISRPPSGLDAGSWAMLLRGSDGGGDSAPDVAITEDWIPIEGGTYQLSACMLRESAGDNVLVDFDDGKGLDADFADVHLVAASTGTWECRAVTTCIPGSVGAVRIRASRSGANLGDAWFDGIELKRIAACAE